MIVHVAAEPVAGVMQLCARCGRLLLDLTYVSYPIGQESSSPSFWTTGHSILTDSGMSLDLANAKPDRDTSDEIECVA